jgi:hypothetical protein
MLAHPIAGPSLRNYLILTEFPELLDSLCLSDADRLWSRYYWFARFAMEWHAIVGYDAGLEQQLSQLLEYADVDCGPLAEIETAVRRDAVVSPRTL